MNKKKLLSTIVSLLMVASVAIPGQFTKVKAAEKDQWNTARYGDTIDVDSRIRTMEKDPVLRAKMDKEIMKATESIDFNTVSAQSVADNEGNFTYNGGTKKFVAYDNQNGNYYKEFTLRSIGQKVEVWVANDLKFLPGDSRPVPVITQEQVDKLRDEFDKNIYQKDTEFFGVPNSRTGQNPALKVPAGYYAPADGIERVIMLVDNCRDENYYDPSYPFYVAGFFSPTFARYFDRNVINIDTNRWDARIPNNSIYGTVAHEFQHLIHSDNDPDEESWINEGMADFAQYLCGYGHDWGHVNFFLDHPENSLVSWDEQYNAPTGPETLADYGQAYLFQLYLNDHFGKNFIQALAKEKTQGINSVNKVLAQFNTGIDFTELFRRFSAALSVDSKNPGNGIYNFSSIDVKVNYKSAQTFQKDGVPAWGVDYLKLENTKNIKDIIFNGVSFVTNSNPWKVVPDTRNSANNVLWGNNADKNDNKLVFWADLTNVQKATLKFDNYYYIEKGWDYGFVQVSDDGGKTWKSLANNNTKTYLDPGAKSSIGANVPGFTGTNEAWTNEVFDLSAYAGKKILVNFRYMTDDAYTDPGWYVDNISIPEINYTNTCDDMSKFENLDKILGNYVDYSVTFINEKYTNKGTEPQHYQVKTLDLVNMTAADEMEIQKFLSSGNNYMLVWYAAKPGTTGVVDYSYELVLKDKLNKKK
ncbi:immune inhibitor A [Clostridium sp. YIM B02515]|uniref:Immune inhibitor A n=1 Tax=Clostridium rhizosphaerae TaxID=2803861 RepID=A0ABS1TDM6_9CLOT|nr:immune inhibitor A domain-containing protein [Clostridium rhizosphaerae]MBL4936439.1 immune inhibitor A [Clostridium rhizosphaerae]